VDEKIIEMLGKLLEGQTELQAGQTEIKAQMARMEEDLGNKIGALFDFQKVQHDVNEKIFERLDRLEIKVDKLQLETAHVRLVK
jgi:hypothetical protein